MNSQDYFSFANKFSEQGLYEKAIEYYLKAISLSESSGEISSYYYENLAFSYFKLPNEKFACSYASKALEIDSNCQVARYVLQELNALGESNSDLYSFEYPNSHPVSIIRSAIIDSRIEELKSSNIYSGNKDENSFVLYRIIGNDLYPRHSLGQSRINVEYILKNEPDLPGCKKIWVVNRIVDENERNKVFALLDNYDQEYLEIPFVASEYSDQDFDYSTLPNDFLKSNSFAKKGPAVRERILTTVYRAKNKYAMNNNGARNFALEHGRQYSNAKWILPWDGNCFITPSAWSEIVRDIKKSDFLSYFVVPMARVTANDLLLLNDYRPDPSEEPQLIFRSDTKEKFNDEFCYGRRPKVEMFWYLGIPGLWDNYKDDEWDPKRRGLSSDAYKFGVAGWTARLNSGMKEQEAHGADGSRSRFAARQVAIVMMLNYLDNKSSSLQQIASPLKKTLLSMLPAEAITANENPDKGFTDCSSKILPDNSIIFVARRADGLGERFRAILNAMYFARSLNQKFKIWWPLRGQEQNVFNAIETPEEVFSSDFISNNLLVNNLADKDILDLNKVGPLNCSDLINYSLEGRRYFSCEQSHPSRYMSLEELPTPNFKNLFSEIGFSSKLTNIISYTDELSFDSEVIAVHVRGGDIVYGEYRDSQRYQQKLIPLLVALELTKDFVEQGKKVLVFLQDKQLSSLFSEICSVSLSHDLADPNWNKLELAFFEIYLMSKCSSIICGTSGFAAVASKIGGISCFRYEKFIDKREAQEVIKSGLSSYQLEPLQEAFNILMYILFKEDDIGLEECDSLLIRASVLDPSNVLYPTKRIFNFVKFKRYEDADKLISSLFFADGSNNFNNLPIIRTLCGKIGGSLVMLKYFDSILDNDFTNYEYINVLKLFLSKLTGKIKLSDEVYSLLKLSSDVKIIELSKKIRGLK